MSPASRNWRKKRSKMITKITILKPKPKKKKRMKRTTKKMSMKRKMLRKKKR